MEGSTGYSPDGFQMREVRLCRVLRTACLTNVAADGRGQVVGLCIVKKNRPQLN